MEQDKNERARQQARAQVESIAEMVAKLDRESAAALFVAGLTRDELNSVLIAEIAAGNVPASDHDEEQDDDAHRKNAPVCAQCGGQCYFDDDGNRVVRNQGEEPEKFPIVIIDYVTELTDDDAREMLAEAIADDDSNPSDFEFDEEAARRDIEQDPLSIDFSGSWSYGQKPEADEVTFLLCTGGPAVKIICDFDGSEATRPRVMFQGWFTPWEELHDISQEEREALEKYVACFYLGECE